MIGPRGTDLDVFYTLPTSLGLKWEFERALIERKACTIEPWPDVHRAHGIRNAILVVATTSIDRHVRLAIAHAWREGVRRWILLFANKTEPGDETTEIEQELRVLLDSLGDGGGAPAIRSALTRCAGRTSKGMRAAMTRLLEEIERVFAPADEAVIDVALPATFADEVAILDAILPLIRPATMIGRRTATLAETAALHGGNGGSHAGGWPYLEQDEAWPDCPRCSKRAPCFMQIDTRDVLHSTPSAHRLFVIYRCTQCHDAGVVVRHYATPTKERRQPLLEDDDDGVSVLVMEKLAHHLPDGEIIEARDPELWSVVGKDYWDAETAMGMGSLRIPDHLGGWETSQYAGMEPPCSDCGATLLLVSTTQWGDSWNSLWACAEHPDVFYFRCHK